MIAIGAENRWHLQLAQRWIVQYNFYINDRTLGRMFVRICPYLPFSARVCLKQHHWLANRMRCEDIDFKQCSNAFLRCRANPDFEKIMSVPEFHGATTRLTGETKKAAKKCRQIRVNPSGC
jgi:hypothetical protein